MIPLDLATDIVFWICGPLMIAGALGLVLFKKAVYSALSMAFAMVNLAAIYIALDAPLLGAAQIIVYTGAIMMLFLFVLMLVGVDRPDSLVEKVKRHKLWAVLAGLGVSGLIIFAVFGQVTSPAKGLTEANAEYGGNIESLAALIFNRYVFAFELTSALLITAAVGALVLAQHARLTPKPTQRDRALARMQAYANTGKHPGALPNSGVMALNNSIATGALLPDGSVADDSISQALIDRDALVDEAAIKAKTAAAFAEIASAQQGNLIPVATKPAVDAGQEIAGQDNAGQEIKAVEGEADES